MKKPTSEDLLYPRGSREINLEVEIKCPYCGLYNCNCGSQIINWNGRGMFEYDIKIIGNKLKLFVKEEL